MKSPNFTLGILAATIAIAATAWKLFPETPVDPFTESATTQSLDAANEKQSGSVLFPKNSNSEDTQKPKVTKIRDRSLAEKTPRDGTNRPAAGPKAPSRPNPVKELLQASAKESFLNAPLPTPAVFIALDPSVSGIPADHEPALQAMAVNAANILKNYETAVEEIEANSTLSPAGKELALLAEKQKAFNGITTADYLFRAKYGGWSWMTHQIAAHRESE
jgi:hypothetical protein